MLAPSPWISHQSESRISHRDQLTLDPNKRDARFVITFSKVEMLNDDDRKSGDSLNIYHCWHSPLPLAVNATLRICMPGWVLPVF
jgi:hypothetical protein